MKCFIVFIVFCSGLLGCSSSGLRAPVSDVTLSSKNHSFKKPAKQKSGSKIAVSKKTARVTASVQKLKSYRVKKGDTLYAIAWKMEMGVKILAKYNNLKSPYTIYVGQLLNLKEKKQSKNQKIVVKNKQTSQKTLTINSGQQNINNKIALKKTKEYPANKANEKVKKIKTTDKNTSSWHWPAKGKLTKSFSASQAGMKGISISNQRGTAIYASTAGQVVYAGSGLRGYGNLIIIKHDYDYLSAYAHNEKLLVGENEQIKAGQKIALMGESETDSVHLHFEIRYRGKSVDPLRYLRKR